MKMTLGTISVALSVTTAVLSMGTLAVTILGGAQTLLSMAATTYNFCRDMNKAEKDIIGTDRELAKSWTDKKLTKDKVARELAAALGVPFVKSVVSLQALLTEYHAKNARKDKMAEDMWSEAKKLMEKIEVASKQGSDKQRVVLQKLGAAVDSLLSQIGKLSATSASNDLFYDVYKARCDTYRAMESGSLGKTADATAVVVLLAGIASSAKTVVSIAIALA